MIEICWLLQIFKQLSSRYWNRLMMPSWHKLEVLNSAASFRCFEILQKQSSTGSRLRTVLSTVYLCDEKSLSQPAYISSVKSFLLTKWMLRRNWAKVINAIPRKMWKLQSLIIVAVQMKWGLARKMAIVHWRTNESLLAGMCGERHVASGKKKKKIAFKHI